MSAQEAIRQERERRAVSVRGIVQGVGFRPFIYSLARRHGLSGWVRNDAQGVEIEVEGSPEHLERFLGGIVADRPPLAVVETVSWQPLVPAGEEEFRILESRQGLHRNALVSPDVATCEACLRELFDPSDRRYRYPFINCTDCGPRFTITLSVPYDRPATTMAGFVMCAACQREYDDPQDRRFHAQPNACPICGPRVRLADPSGRELPSKADDAITAAARLLKEGAILAVKGLGGYHLACDPFNPAAVRALRERKVRQDRPFALMVQDLEQARELCRVTTEEAALLTSLARPIVLLERREGVGVAEEVAPRQRTLGVMLAYTPLHHLLLRDFETPLVMTSGNRSDEPIAYRDEEAFEQLSGIADAFLTHSRPIHMRCDDSVVTHPVFLRRSRGYAPAPLRIAGGFKRQVLACGGELKSTFCLGKGEHAFLSHHIGDLENYETLRSFREGIEHYCRLFDLQPSLVACDLHPEYLSTRYAQELEEAGLPLVRIQHHHAHVASCLADNERPDDERVIGVALDGTGYGLDGAIWGGEFFEGSTAQGFERRAHLEYLPLPGGEAAIHQPWRMAVACLIELFGEDEALRLPLPVVQGAGERAVRNIARLLERGLHTPLTSSTGRLFDAVAALFGLPGTDRITYEGQAAIELEQAAWRWVSWALPGGPGADPSNPTEMGSAAPARHSANRHSRSAALERPAPNALVIPLDRPNGSFKGASPNSLVPEGNGWIVETRQILAEVVALLQAGRPVEEIAYQFHLMLAEAVAACCRHLREARGPSAVALSGGTFQNALLLEQVVDRLEHAAFTVYQHRRVPPNDGGLCLGQAVLADRMLKE